MQRVLCWNVLLIAVLFASACSAPQPAAPIEPSREHLISAAREMIQDVSLCVLITIDDSGRSSARTMDPFPPDEKMVVWMATNRHTRKVQEITNDPRVTLFYSAGEDGYVKIQGTARLVDDPDEKAARWKDGWEEFYPTPEDTYLLIQVIPESLEIVSYQRNLLGDPTNWKPPRVLFPRVEQ